MAAFAIIKSFVQFVTVSFSLVINSILIYLVITKSSKKLGNYRHLMCYFSLFSMVYAVLDWIVQPFIHSHGASFSMIMDLRESALNKKVAFFFVASLAGCFGVSIYAIAINFIFRYFALQREGRLRYFAGKRLILWFCIPLFGGLSWVFLCWCSMAPDPEFTNYLRDSIRANYDLDADFITYTGSYFYRFERDGSVKWSIENSLGALGLNVLMIIPFFIILIFGYRSYKKISKLMAQGECDYTKRLQMQLYKALVAQTIIPMVLLSFPIGILFSAPLLHLDIENGSIIVTFFYSLYPAIDPIPIILFIDDFRNAFFGVFQRRPSKNQVASVVSVDATVDVS
ncbi:Serpentine receptor class r-10 [Caenorhabditis elegans]|uniref:Serpentine receptor class r-10 n=1 Tax=Caenorhabditis elegans TaxID=6239 RepID=Q9N2T2_CAEEL|nr:Seven TM Receptor [Caenorhabditis elegans]CCD68691.1 Seven TM Receptor [Caenorhabditis elegans]|eukprot:NP_500677.2 Seven TM Receptor [Caenorhabditis elegans]